MHIFFLQNFLFSALNCNKNFYFRVKQERKKQTRCRYMHTEPHSNAHIQKKLWRCALLQMQFSTWIEFSLIFVYNTENSLKPIKYIYALLMYMYTQTHNICCFCYTRKLPVGVVPVLRVRILCIASSTRYSAVGSFVSNKFLLCLHLRENNYYVLDISSRQKWKMSIHSFAHK